MEDTKPESGGLRHAAAGMYTQLGKLFENSICDIFFGEKALIKALEKISRDASSPDLLYAIANYLIQTEEHISRLEKVFSILGKEPRGGKCVVIEELIKESETIIAKAEEGAVCDSCIITLAQEITQYEISSYITLCAHAQTLGLDEVVSILETTLEEEKEMDNLLNVLALSNINLTTALEPEE